MRIIYQKMFNHSILSYNVERVKKFKL